MSHVIDSLAEILLNKVSGKFWVPYLGVDWTFRVAGKLIITTRPPSCMFTWFATCKTPFKGVIIFCSIHHMYIQLFIPGDALTSIISMLSERNYFSGNIILMYYINYICKKKIGKI